MLRSVVAEALVIGFVSSLSASPRLRAGKGLIALFTAAGLDLPRAGIVVAPRTVLISLAVGTLVTVLAGLLPGSGRPSAADLGGARGRVLPKGRLSRYALPASLTLIALAAASVGYGLSSTATSVAAHVVSSSRASWRSSSASR